MGIEPLRNEIILGPETSLRFYCEQCGLALPVEIVQLKADDLNAYPWAEIACLSCYFVIATITTDEPGHLVFVTEEQAQKLPMKAVNEAD